MEYPGLEGKNVLLLAGHSNLGCRVTALFAQSGANVFIGARDTGRAEEVASRARKLDRGGAYVIRVDATDRDSLLRALEAVQRHGELDVCYHGVGWHVPGRFLDLSPDLWDRLYEINFKSVLLTYHAVLPLMVKQHHGCVITMSSVLARRATATAPVYGALKCALIHLAQTLALDVAQYGVRINVVAPGPTPPLDASTVTENSSFRGMDPIELRARLKHLTQEIPLRSLGEPDDVAHAVLYLSSPVTGRYLTGQVLGVDGGWWMPK